MSAMGKVWSVFKRAMLRLNGWRQRYAGLMHDSILRRLTSGRPPIGLPILLVVALAVAVWPGSAAASDCFHYGQVATLSGHYFADVAPPDDGIVRDPKNDAARRTTLLSLATPLCVNADRISGGVRAALTVQLSCPGIHPADGTELSIKGRLFGAHLHNGQTPVLLMCL